MKRFFADYYDDTLYFLNPVDYTANLHDPAQIGLLRQQDIIIVSGREDPNVASAEKLSANLWRVGVGNALRLWDGWAHDWPYWHSMIRLYIGGHD
jgi:esterase/lipase superfamily enzyme